MSTLESVLWAIESALERGPLAAAIALVFLFLVVVCWIVFQIWASLPEKAKNDAIEKLASLRAAVRSKIAARRRRVRVGVPALFLLGTLIFGGIFLLSMNLFFRGAMAPASINALLKPAPEGRLMFSKRLDQAENNMHFIGMTDSYTLKQCRTSIIRAIERGVDLTFSLYAPVLPEDEASREEVARTEYHDILMDYRPNGELVNLALSNMWRSTEPDGTLSMYHDAFDGTGSIDDFQRLAKAHYTKRLYSNPPKGWLVIFDYDENERTARHV